MLIRSNSYDFINSIANNRAMPKNLNHNKCRTGAENLRELTKLMYHSDIIIKNRERYLSQKNLHGFISTVPSHAESTSRHLNACSVHLYQDLIHLSLWRLWVHKLDNASPIIAKTNFVSAVFGDA